MKWLTAPWREVGLSSSISFVIGEGIKLLPGVDGASPGEAEYKGDKAGSEPVGEMCEGLRGGGILKGLKVDAESEEYI